MHEVDHNNRWKQQLLPAKDGGKPGELPFVCTDAQIRMGTERAKLLQAEGLLPSEVAYMQLFVVFTNAGWLKLHDKLILTGPVLKWLLDGFFAPNERRCLFK